MRKLISYFILGTAIIGFIFIYVITGSLFASLIIIILGTAWFLFENFVSFDPFDTKSKEKKDYLKAKKNLNNKTEDNPTLR